MYDDKYYIVEGGPLLVQAQAFRENYILWGEQARAFIKKHGAITGQVGFGGKFFSLKFEGDAPEGFKKAGKFGCQQPYVKNKEWIKILEDGPTEPQSSDFIKKAMDIVYSIGYKKEGCDGRMRLGNPFTPVSVCYYSEDSPLLLILPDAQKSIDKKQSEGYAVTPSSYTPPDGIREILKEEWDLMVAKHKQAQKS